MKGMGKRNGFARKLAKDSVFTIAQLIFPLLDCNFLSGTPKIAGFYCKSASHFDGKNYFSGKAKSNKTYLYRRPDTSEHVWHNALAHAKG
ncbi:hypothetical protein HYS31_00615 [Candidatus Woesearchaeota archaeon]|nr:hypothetical protein [Candidatus Woesearchaeota archaeon]